MPSGPTKDMEQKEAAYDLLWPTVTTKCNISIRKGSHSLFDGLVVTVGHNKSYAASSCTTSLAGSEGRSVQVVLMAHT